MAGDLPPTHELVTMFGAAIEVMRRGEMARDGQPHEQDMAFLRLTQWCVEPHDEYEEGIKHFEEIATTLSTWTSANQILKDIKITKWLRVGMVRRTDQGGITFPPELVSSLAAMGMSLHISMTVILDDDSDDGDDEPCDNDPVCDPDVGVVVS